MNNILPLREHSINSTDTFIRGWYIDHSICDELLDVYNSPDVNKFPGLSVDPNRPTPYMKDSIDATIPANSKLIENYVNALRVCVDNYTKYFYYSTGSKGYAIKQAVNIQHYKIGGGFKQWHCERSSSDEFIRDRHMVFMTYLNDVDDGGTEFFYQKLTVKAEKGLTLIWPADWTHTHKGQISNTKEKTIITGWFSF